MTVDELRSMFRSDEVNEANAFQVLQQICSLASRAQDVDAPQVQELVLRALNRREVFRAYGEILSGLTRHFGLYPYLQEDGLTIKDAIAREYHRPRVLNDADDADESIDGPVLHRVQAEVFRRLLDGENIILSAPTSFGKSSLVDALIDQGTYRNVVIVVPTIALIDEVRRRLARFKSTHKVITHASQHVGEQNIFVLTQERAIDFPSIPEIDLFVLDEFYKLDPAEESQRDRAMTLNLAFYKFARRAKQFYLLGPNIQAIPEGFPDRFRCQFIRTDFATVVTELIPVNSKKGQEYERLLELCNDLNDSTLIYCASPAKARRVTEMLAMKLDRQLAGMEDAANWAAENYHAGWTLVKGLAHGIGMHHGRMPRALAQLCVKGFNEGRLPFLVCTSTLIEGVNTKAKNVIIFDNKIATQKYDFFTFNNIKGRSGRMFQHFIGNVFLFHEPPQEELPFVDIPVFSQDEQTTSESLLVQLDEEDLSKDSKDRLKPYRAGGILDYAVIQQNSGIEPADQVELARTLMRHPELLEDLSWSGYPEYKQVQHLCEVIWTFFVKKSGRLGGVSSGSQLAYKINLLRVASFKDVVQKRIDEGTDADEAVEGELEFIRQWPQFRFPRLAMGVCRIQQAIASRVGRPRLAADYTFFVGQVESLFADSALTALDEYGLPFPLARKLEGTLGADGSLDQALANLAAVQLDGLNLSPFERSLVEDVRRSL